MKPTRLIMGAALMSFATTVNADTAIFGIHGITDPNVPAGYVANEVFWDGGGTVDWPSTALRIDLSVGSFYQDPFGSNGPSPQAFIDLIPTLEFDTYVGIIGTSPTYIPGGAGDVGGGPLSLDAPQLSVSWGNADPTNTGLVRIGMVTLSDDAVGTGQMFSRGTTQSFTVNNGQVLGALATLEADPTQQPDPVDPGPFPQLPGPPPYGSIGVTAQTVSSIHVPDGYVANEIVWYGAGQQDWESTAMRADLTSGDVYQHPDGFDKAPNPLLLQSYPELEFDTYVGILNDDGGGIVAGAGDLGGGTLSLDGPHISIGWVNVDPFNRDTERIGMLTLSEDANGVIAFSSGGVEWSTTIVNGVIIAPGAPGDPDIPEPATLTLLALAGPFLLRRR